MKAIRLFVTMMLFGIAMGVTAQVAPSELKIKASKEAKKECKRMTKEGWKPFPGGLPLERQLDRVYAMEYDTDLSMESKWAFGEGLDHGQFFEAAKGSANAFAMSDLVGKLHTEVTREVTAQVKNKELPEEQANSVAGMAESSKSLTVQRLSGIQPVLQAQRKLKNGNTEVMVRFAYLRSKAKNDTFNYINGKCKEEGIDFQLAGAVE